MTGPASEALVKAYAAADDAEMARRIAEASYENALRQRDEARAERDGWMETARSFHAGEQAFAQWLREAGEHLRPEVTICDDGTDAGEVLIAKVPECVAALKTERDEARAEAERLREALRDVLALEAEKASNKGDCCCMFWDRTREREYETGTCPHQRARAALNTTRND